MAPGLSPRDADGPAEAGSPRASDWVADPPPSAFAVVAELAAYTLRVPLALVCLIDGGHRRVRAAACAHAGWSVPLDVPLPRWLCGRVVDGGDPVAVGDLAREGVAAADAGVVGDPPASYLGVPLTAGGRPVGTLCVLDAEPRAWTPGNVAVLAGLAATVSAELRPPPPRRPDPAGPPGPSDLPALLSSAAVGFAVWDADGRPIGANPAMAQAAALPLHAGARAAGTLGDGLDEVALQVIQGPEPVVRWEARTAPTAEARDGRDWLATVFRVDEAADPRPGAAATLVEVTGRHAARERRAVLTEMADVLDRAIGLDERLELLTRLVVPRVADFCTIDLADEGGRPRLVAAAHRDAEKEPLLVAARSSGGVMPDGGAGLESVLRTGAPDLVADVDPAMAERMAEPTILGGALRILAPTSALTVPLEARGRVLGAMTLVHGDSGRRYGQDDVAFAMAVARRAALSIDNARLYEAGQRTRLSAQRLAGERAELLASERAARDLAQGTLDALSSEVALLDESGVVLEANRVWRRRPAAGGWPEGVAVGSDYLAACEAAGAPEAATLAAGVREVIAGTRPDFSIEYPLGGPQERWLLARVTRFPVGGSVRVAIAHEDITARRLSEDLHRSIATSLQRSLLPAALPEVHGVRLAARYLPAGAHVEVGGDWYEVIELPEGRAGLGVGDVVGRGPEAAAVMGQLRAAMRAHALDGHGPAAVLGRLSRFAEDLPGSRMATMAYAVLDPARGELRYACAGHPPPLVVTADGRTRQLEGGRGTPLGVFAGAPYAEEVAHLAPGTSVLLYTDGLVERRREGLDEGLARLAAAAAEVAGAEPEAMCDHALERLFPAGPPGDDVALLVARLAGAAQPPLSRRVPARPTELAGLRAAVRSWLEAAGATTEETGDVVLAVGECIANAAEHAYPPDAPGPLELSLWRGVGPDEIVVRVRDAGRWREPRPGPSIRGRGMVMMRRLMDAVDIAHGSEGTEVTMRRRFTPPAAPVTVLAGDDAAAPEALGVTVEEGPEGVVARLVGEVDAANAGVLASLLRRAATARSGPLTVDLARLAYLESAGVRALVDLGHDLRRAGHELTLVVPPTSPVRRTLDHMRVDLLAAVRLAEDAAA